MNKEKIIMVYVYHTSLINQNNYVFYKENQHGHFLILRTIIITSMKAKLSEKKRLDIRTLTNIE